MSPVASYPITWESPFTTLPELLALHARHQPNQAAIIHDGHQLSYAELDVQVNYAAAALQRDGLQPGDSIAICAANSLPYAVVLLGALRAGMVVAPLAPSSTADGLVIMLRDSAAKLLFVDQSAAQTLQPVEAQIGIPQLRLDDSQPEVGFSQWLADSMPTPVTLTPDTLFNIIYSSGTTGEPKGIVHDHRMRWAHIRRGVTLDYRPGSVTLMSTPLYSNTTLVSFLPTIGMGATLVLMSKFDAQKYLELAQEHRATHSMLVPVQYQRIMAHKDFDRYDLSSFKLKTSTSAPFHAELKADVLARWPGGLVEFYGMTEGGGSCILEAHLFPNKLHTVGKPPEGHDLRVIDEDGNELPEGEIGEVVGHSVAMMSCYLNKPEKTAEAEWYDHTGKRFIRTGDVGQFDKDGFLTLMDRRKDMIISGGFNIYPSDLEAVLRQHPDLLDVTVIGVTSTSWGETPVGYAVLKPGVDTPAEDIVQWFNAQVGKTQRLNRLILTNELPRSAIGKVLKRELRDQFQAEFGTLD